MLLCSGPRAVLLHRDTMTRRRLPTPIAVLELFLAAAYRSTSVRPTARTRTVTFLKSLAPAGQRARATLAGAVLPPSMEVRESAPRGEGEEMGEWERPAHTRSDETAGSGRVNSTEVNSTREREREVVRTARRHGERRFSDDQRCVSGSRGYERVRRSLPPSPRELLSFYASSRLRFLEYQRPTSANCCTRPTDRGRTRLLFDSDSLRAPTRLSSATQLARTRFSVVSARTDLH